jgi:sugar lactone lactonase YvrE
MSAIGIRAAIAAAILAPLGVQPAVAETPAAGILDLALKTREARLAGDNAGWLEHGRATLARAPEHPDLLITVARALAANGRVGESIPFLEQAIARGAGFDLFALAEYKDARDNASLAALAARAAANRVPVSAPEEYLNIENTGIEPEGITWDAKTSRLFVGSLSGGIWAIDENRAIVHFAGHDTGLREVLGLKVDSGRRLLWAVTGVFPDIFGPPDKPKKHSGLTGLMAFNLDSGEPVHSCWLDELPVQHGFNDLALASAGSVYVSDSVANAIYRLTPAGCRFERVMQDPLMGFPNGIALSPDESLLYVAHIEGLSAVELATGKRVQFAVPADAAVNSMDGLVRDGADLVGIQPSPYLARVVRIRMAPGGRALREVITVSSRPPSDLSQLTGTVAGAHFYSVASSTAPPGPDGEDDRRARVLRSNLRL